MAVKVIKFEIIETSDPLYRVMRQIINAHHERLSEAKIALAWKLDWQPNADGKLILGMCKKASDLDRLLHDYDFVILLNKDYWDEFSDKQQRAIIDHELMHADTNNDERGKPKRDENDRIVYRMRDHDLEEFRAIIERHGCYKADIEAFAQSIQKSREMPLFEQEDDTPIAGQVGEAM